MPLKGGRLAGSDEPNPHFPVFQDQPRNHPPGGHDVCPLPAFASECRRSAARAGIDFTHETVRFWWNRFGTIFAGEIRRSRVQAMLLFRHIRSLQKFATVHSSVHDQFAPQTFGSTRNDTSHPDRLSRIAALPHSPRGANPARPDPCRGRGLSETFLGFVWQHRLTKHLAFNK